MAKIQELNNINQFKVKAAQPNSYYWGGSQYWYADKNKQKCGCGPTTASEMIWYFAKTRPSLSGLCDVGAGDRDSFTGHMDRIFESVTPGLMGISNPQIFANGVVDYGKKYGVKLEPIMLNVPTIKSKRPTVDKMTEFLDGSFKKDRPVAFLNLSNGNVAELGGWHWVILVSIDTDTKVVTMLDQGKKVEFNIGDWLETTSLGGGFVTLNC